MKVNMRLKSKQIYSGFSLVEVLSVLLIVATVAAIAVPTYMRSRKDSAARICKNNIAGLAAVEASYATRFGSYCGDTAATTAWEANYTSAATTGNLPTGGLIGAPDGLAAAPVCPLDGKHYRILLDNTAGTCTISCPNASTHSTDTNGGGTTPWSKTLLPMGNDNTRSL